MTTVRLELTSLQAHIIFEALHFPDEDINHWDAIEPVIKAMKEAGVWDAPSPKGVFRRPK